ncbi:hypothetical protein PGT21_016493 [Puccinia graminis f. sp. tritici]|uniref:J domain-containing protein n=1 Tax=Puccinia graminis f. sp. tritici TaxID=56615 RepID=A0A5B0NX66_PUCGR|nr:hypothetical protein PGT21_016493 [Puccinia graminis f. sp. tritici]KAA1093312.1 hypothetical protein PGTUg99_017444 [Puccinia graminis f. sp. tritici]
MTGLHDQYKSIHAGAAGCSKALWKARRALGDFLYFSAPQRVLLRFVVRGNLLDGLANTRFTPKSLCFSDMFRVIGPPLSPLFCSELHSSQVSHTPVPYYFPRCHPLSPPWTPHVTPPTPVGPGLPPPLPPLIRSEPRFRPSVLPLLVAPPQYTLHPRSAVGRDPRCPPVPGFPRSKLFRTLRIRSTFPRFPAPRKARLSTNAPPLSSACVHSVSSVCFPPSADLNQITSAYRKASLKVHPDRNPDDPLASEKFQALKTAFEILLDPIKQT